jgi:Inosine-uridine preferring nucleoside hydrolase
VTTQDNFARGIARESRAPAQDFSVGGAKGARSDDWLAALLLRSPAVDLKAITVTGAGLASVRRGVAHALGLAALAGKGEVPVAAGRQTPLRGDNAFPRPCVDAGCIVPRGPTTVQAF